MSNNCDLLGLLLPLLAWPVFFVELLLLPPLVLSSYLI